MQTFRETNKTLTTEKLIENYIKAQEIEKLREMSETLMKN